MANRKASAQDQDPKNSFISKKTFVYTRSHQNKDTQTTNGVLTLPLF